MSLLALALVRLIRPLHVPSLITVESRTIAVRRLPPQHPSFPKHGKGGEVYKAPHRPSIGRGFAAPHKPEARASQGLAPTLHPRRVSTESRLDQVQAAGPFGLSSKVVGRRPRQRTTAESAERAGTTFPRFSEHSGLRIRALQASAPAGSSTGEFALLPRLQAPRYSVHTFHRCLCTLAANGSVNFGRSRHPLPSTRPFYRRPCTFCRYQRPVALSPPWLLPPPPALHTTTRSLRRRVGPARAAPAPSSIPAPHEHAAVFLNTPPPPFPTKAVFPIFNRKPRACGLCVPCFFTFSTHVEVSVENKSVFPAQ